MADLEIIIAQECIYIRHNNNNDKMAPNIIDLVMGSIKKRVLKSVSNSSYTQNIFFSIIN